MQPIPLQTVAHKSQAQLGQGMVEFSIILVVLVGLFVGVFEIMMLYGQRTDMETITRMAGRQAAELYVSDGSNPVDVQAAIREYVLQEMERIGYDRTELESDASFTVEVIAYQYDEISGAIVLDPGASRCQYGDYISVKMERQWQAAVLPLSAFFNAQDTGLLEMEYMNKCWRGE